MGITDEMRKYVADNNVIYITPYASKRLFSIADSIDAEHERQLEVLYRDMSDAEYVKLPVDADGVPIHLGDEVYQMEGGWVYTVKSITFYPDNVTVSFASEHGFGCDSAHSVHHYHEPTVEDLLFSYGQACIRASNEAETEAAKQTMLSSLRHEYAEKLRLTDDGKEQ